MLDTTTLDIDAIKKKRNPSVVIIGAGMTGILMVIKLREAGITNITILEKTHNIGGTWRENTYPGVACDVPSHMYTYSFEPNPEWSNFFAKGPEIQQYFERVARKYGVMDIVRFNEAVTDARFKEGKWQVKTSKGAELESDFLIAATGILHHPAYPDIEGLDSFKGEMFHTARWNHDADIAPGKKVGVIGTGSTAAQFIPELVKTGADVNVFMRTPQWLLPIPDFTISEKTKQRMKKRPWLARASRSLSIALLEHFFTKAVTGHKIQRWLLETACKLNIRFSIKDPELRKKLTPDYKVGCKRVIINKTFYNGIQQPNAHLITEGIVRITEKCIVTKDAAGNEQEHELDVLVLSTGFNPFNFMRPMNMIGREELHIDDAWSERIKAYRSLMLPNYPNFFLMLGPNTPIGNFSVIAMSEVQTNWVIKLIDRWRDGEYDEVEAPWESVNKFNAYVKKGLEGTAWVGGCQSWYLDADGDPILWPYTWQRWVDEMEQPKMEDLMTAKFRPTNPEMSQQAFSDKEANEQEKKQKETEAG